MIGALSNHLWQSTLFALAAALVAAALRKNGAHIRHLVWLAASFKFLVPFSLLMSLGGRWAWARPAASTIDAPPIDAASVVVNQIAQPFTDAFPPTMAPQSHVDWLPIVLTALWACGFIAVLLMRLRGWIRVRAAVRASAPLTLSGVDLPRRVDVRAAPGLLEPGIVGLWRPVLLLPAGIHDHLTPIQLEAVLTHEFCHIRRRDNVTAAVHMLVESIFWFHPLVWWIGARMVDERERACDEHVLSVLGKPEAYAEGILNVCKLYVESPLTCVSGVTGSNLKARIESILGNRIGTRLNFARKTAITAAAIFALSAPVIVGMIGTPAHVYGQDSAGPERFDVISIKPCAAPGQPASGGPPAGAGRGSGGAASWSAQTTPGRVYWDCVTLATLVDQAYAGTDHPLLHMTGDSRPSRNDGIGPTHPKRVRGGPAWAEKDMFTVEVTAPAALTASALQGAGRRNLATLPPAMASALRAALEDRFQLKAHRATEQQDMYALRLGDRGLDAAKITLPVAGDCLTRAEYFDWVASAPPRPPARTIAEAEAASPRICGEMYSTMAGMEFSSAPLSMLAARLSETMDRFVLDETGVDTKFNFKLRSGEGETTDQRQAAGVVQLGLKLQPVKATAEFLVIDRAEKPTPNEAFAQPSAQKFDVASIKPCEPGAAAPGPGRGNSPGNQVTPGYLNLSCLTLRQLVSRAYLYNPEDRLRNRKWEEQFVPGFPAFIRGGPSWITAERFTIEARAEGVTDSRTLSGPMLRALLEDRFQLKTHRATEERSMDALSAGKTALKITPTRPGECLEHEPGTPMPQNDKNLGPCGYASGDGWGTYQLHGVILGANGREGQRFVDQLWDFMLQPILDRTGLTGRYSFDFNFTPDENTPGVNGQCGGNPECMSMLAARGPRRSAGGFQEPRHDLQGDRRARVEAGAGQSAGGVSRHRCSGTPETGFARRHRVDEVGCPEMTVHVIRLTCDNCRA